MEVWGLPVRLFHWLLVLGITVALSTGFLAPEWWLGIHRIAGYGVLVLMVLRLVWGFLGPHYARFHGLIRALRGFGAYARGLIRLRPPHYVGHNPVGAAMILAFFLVVSAIVVTGLLAEGGEEKLGPLAGVTSFALGDAARAVHSWAAILLLAMVIVHLLGVLVESLLQKVNLARGMISGRMPLPAGLAVEPPRTPARPMIAGLTAVALASAGGLVLLPLMRLPPLGVAAVRADAAHQKECGDCHWPYHPTLLPRASWEKLMAGLEDHFGEDASLSEATTREIARYLEANAAETTDTEVGNRFRTVAAEEPLRITGNPYWIARHRRLDRPSIAASSAKSPGNCIACHGDADSGRFDDEAISLPEGVVERD
ncbi:MAG: cytochrome b/b6 domain-containing protein [Hyphomicrobiaceae bacterium]